MRRRIGWAVLVAVALGAAPTPAAAQEPGRLNFVNAELRDVIRSLAAVLGINVLITEDVPSRRIFYTTTRPVPVEQLGAVLEAILESEGLALVHDGPVARVVDVEDMPAAGPVHFGKTLPSPPPLGLITQVVPLEAVRAEEAVAVLEQLAAPTARIDVMPRSNAVTITDRAGNIARYLELLRELDVRGDGEDGMGTYVYRLKHASAEELALTLGEVFGGGPARGLARRPQSLEDYSLSRTLERFRARELEALEMRRQVVPPVAPVTVDTAVGTGAMAQLPGPGIIVPDPSTNSLIIRTAPPNYPLIRQTIDSLDVRPAQVLLEVVVAEITLDEAHRWGIDWSALASDVQIAGRSGDVGGRLGPQQFADSLLAGVEDFVLRVVRLNDIDIRAVLRLLSTDAEVRVLSTPHILALNNETARILVGSQVPFNASTRVGLDVVVDRIIQYRDVGTQLTIIPTINPDGYVTFRMLQEVSALTSQTLEAALNAPIITTREAETSALVRHGETIVIGGLIGDSREEIETGVPLLKDIPLLGLLFKSRSTLRTRTELAIFLTPYVVRTDEDARDLLRRERRRLDGLPEDWNDELPPGLKRPGQR